MNALHMLAASLSLAFAAPAFAEPPADIGESVEALRQKIGAVGVSIAIVADGKTTLARGWGPRKLGETAQVDAETIGRASCRERVCQSVSNSVCAVSLQHKTHEPTT